MIEWQTPYFRFRKICRRIQIRDQKKWVRAPKMLPYNQNFGVHHNAKSLQTKCPKTSVVEIYFRVLGKPTGYFLIGVYCQ
jgi:hypothetical protein